MLNVRVNLGLFIAPYKMKKVKLHFLFVLLFHTKEVKVQLNCSCMFESAHKRKGETMRKFFIASHGRLASGMKSSLEILLGSAENVTVLDAYLDQTRVEDAIEAFFAACSSDDQKFLLSDLYGGSVNQVLFRYSDQADTYLIAGVNLAVVLELVAGETHLNEDEIQAILQESRNALCLVKHDHAEIVQEDFF